MNTRGELLFARAIVLSEGETEEQALRSSRMPIGKRSLSRVAWICGVAGMQLLPFLRVADSLTFLVHLQ